MMTTPHLSGDFRRWNMQFFLLTSNDRQRKFCGCFVAWSILKTLMRNAPSMFRTGAAEIWLLMCWDAQHCNFQSFSTWGFIITANLGLASVAPPVTQLSVLSPLPLHSAAFLQKNLCMHALSTSYTPIRRQLAQQIDTAVGFWVICKSAVTVMGAAQRRWRRGKCQHVRKRW